MSKSKIEWTDEVWNPLAGCSIVSTGCKNCYAMRMARRLSAMGQAKYRGLTHEVSGNTVWTGKIILDEDALLAPLRWHRTRRVFVNSMSDLFHEDVPEEFISRVFAIMAMCPQHTFQVLTKRPTRMLKYLKEIQDDDKDLMRWAQYAEELSGSPCSAGMVEDAGWPLPNVWIGVSVENQRAADERIPLLLQTPAAVRFLSCEPLLGPVDLVPFLQQTVEYPLEGDGVLHWVIAGGESGPGARPMSPDWARSIRDQCKDASIPYFFKQWGEWEVQDEQDFNPREFPYPFGDPSKQCVVTCGNRAALMRRVGKHEAGRLLDGRTWDEMPEARA